MNLNVKQGVKCLSGNDAVMRKMVKNYTFVECYARIYKWHKRYGASEFERWAKGCKASLHYKKRYLALLKNIAAPHEASLDEMWAVMFEMLQGSFEWSNQQMRDPEMLRGIKLGVWAWHGLNLIGRTFIEE